MGDLRLGGKGLLNPRSNSELDQEERQRERDRTPPEQPEHIQELAAHIRKAFDDAEKHKATEIQGRLLDCQRRRKGVYGPTVLAEIQKRGGSQLYFNITETKCGAAEAWIQEVMRRTDQQPWKLEATPLADLPGDKRAMLDAEADRRLQEALAAGDDVTPEDIEEFQAETYVGAEKYLDEQAQERADRMAEKIKDQQVEGGWQKAIEDVVQMLCTYPIAILCGPEIKQVQRLKWEGNEPTAAMEAIPTWRNVDPHDFFPAPNIRTVNEGYICEKVRIPDAELSALRGAEGYDADQINAVLSEGESADSVTEQVTSEPERAILEGRDTEIASGAPKSAKDGILFWGSVQGEMLVDWGMEVDDENEYYPIKALLIGKHVVQAITNPDPLGKVPYFVASYENVAGDLIGKAIAEKMADCQDAFNGCRRNVIDNLALSSWPMVKADVDSLDPAVDVTRIYPGKIFQIHSSKANGIDPISFFQPESNAQELMQVSATFEQDADDRTLIPKFAHGNAEVSGAGETKGGLEMLMEAAAKGIKRVIGNLDILIRGAIEHIYRWNLFYLPPEELEQLKGDIRVVPRGMMAALVREEMQRRRQQWLDSTNNDTDMAIIGLEGRATVHRAVIPELDLPVDEVVPSEEDLAAKMQEQAAQEEQMAADEQAAAQNAPKGAKA